MGDMSDLIDELRKVHDEEFGDSIYILVRVPKELIKNLPDLTESQWNQHKRLLYRIDPPDPSLGVQRHIHITNKQHISTKAKQLSWNVDGSRHEKSSFNSSMKGLEKAKKLTRDVLNLDPDVVLEKAMPKQALNESIHCSFRDSDMYSLTVVI